jgi:hypothetical protein
MAEPAPTRRTIRDLPFAARVTIAAFLISVGFGYFAALVQLHVQQAKPGQILPGEHEVIDVYHGPEHPVSTLERLINNPETDSFSSSGSMRAAFTTRSAGWAVQKRKAAGDLTGLDDQAKKKRLAEAEAKLRKERDGEAAILIHWITEGKMDEKAYDDDKYPLPNPLPESMKDTQLSEEWVDKDEASGVQYVRIAGILDKRCVRCHQEGREAGFAPLNQIDFLKAYADPEHGGMPLRKLAQTTHVHLLGFSMLYGLTGLIFACSGWPAFLRLIISPLALAAQVVDISFWWLARMHGSDGENFAKCIRFSGAVVGGALALQIVLGLFSLFGWTGRVVLVLLMVAAGAGGYYVYDWAIAPYLAEQAKLVGM